MSATCWQHVADKAKSCLFLSRQANFGDIVQSVLGNFCVGIFRHWQTMDRQFLAVVHWMDTTLYDDGAALQQQSSDMQKNKLRSTPAIWGGDIKITNEQHQH